MPVIGIPASRKGLAVSTPDRELPRIRLGRLTCGSGWAIIHSTMSDLAWMPVSIRSVSIRNRFFAAPMATQYADKSGLVTDALVDYYRFLTGTGVGLVVVEAAAVHAQGRGWSRELAAWNPDHRSGLARIAAVVHKHRGVAFLQLHHAGRQSLPPHPGEKTVAPSAIPCPVLDRPVRGLRPDEIRRLILAFTDAARSAADAGFDGIELHGAHGYLLHQFCSPLTNKRDDEYGLEPSGLSRFPLEVVRSIRTALPDFPIAYRLSARDYLPGGLTLPQSKTLAQALVGAGVDFISVSGGAYASLHGPESLFGPMSPEAVFRDDARDIREAVSCPVGVAGKIQRPTTAFAIFANQDAHLVGLGRILLRDPLYVQKALGSDPAPVEPCLLCMRCRFHPRGCPDGKRKPEW
jgi:2,4-dienoyl-CoA reductase-like NADH-dependent reductase (Old Yellow Enzyme family)